MLKIILKMALSLMLASTSVCLTANLVQDEQFENGDLLPKIFMLRHSGTDYQSRSLVPEQIQALIQAARWTSSSYNDQPWNFIFCDKYNNPEAYLRVAESVYGQEWIENAPLLIIVIARSNFLYNNKVNDWAEYDTGAAAFSMSLAAAGMGLMAHQIGGFDREEIQEEFEIPSGYVPLALIAVGYEGNPPEESSRTRRPVEENFFSGEWGKSL